MAAHRTNDERHARTRAAIRRSEELQSRAQLARAKAQATLNHVADLLGRDRAEMLARTTEALKIAEAQAPVSELEPFRHRKAS